LRLLDHRYRTVTFDARGRGKSGTLETCSFAADLDDVTALKPREIRALRAAHTCSIDDPNEQKPDAKLVR
jgi:hypothetical protein